jgi:hypothetical protein
MGFWFSAVRLGCLFICLKSITASSGDRQECCVTADLASAVQVFASPQPRCDTIEERESLASLVVRSGQVGRKKFGDSCRERDTFA